MAKLEKATVPSEFEFLDVKIKEFSYFQDSEFKISNVQFNGKRGELIGLVGMSGSGKSTVLKILACNISCDNALMSISSLGKVVNLDSSHIEDTLVYRKYISIVSQDSHVFTQTLRFNITLEQAEDPEFSKFLNEVRGSIDYFKRWDIQEEDIINPKELSAGQKQLISALRSCYLKKPIVLFDEISSSLDADLELALRKLVLMIQENALTIIVAHRIETVVEPIRFLLWIMDL